MNPNFPFDLRPRNALYNYAPPSIPAVTVRPEPTKPPLYDIFTSYHEAGHAAGYINFQRGFLVARVLPGVSSYIKLDGQRIDGIKGIVEGDSFQLDQGPPISAFSQADRSTLFSHSFKFMVTALAGPCAEARYRKEPFASHLMSGGASDGELAKRIARWVADGDEEAYCQLLVRAVRQTEHFVQGKFGVINVIAQLLSKNGVLFGDDPVVKSLLKRSS